eukprot:Lithocolla_globosa_v1_NODE_6312_length_1105_cov_811.770476.p1 type:complete len:113 gc:universal NODE_6312_length_1105_cov_811.770476:820-482(-)
MKSNNLCWCKLTFLFHKDEKETLAYTNTDCLISCFFSGPECASECITEETGLSEPCASCWVQEGLCVLQKCPLQCIDPTSQQCFDCSVRECFPEAVECTGIPLKYLEGMMPT